MNPKELYPWIERLIDVSGLLSQLSSDLEDEKQPLVAFAIERVRERLVLVSNDMTRYVNDNSQTKTDDDSST